MLVQGPCFENHCYRGRDSLVRRPSKGKRKEKAAEKKMGGVLKKSLRRVLRVSQSPKGGGVYEDET